MKLKIQIDVQDIFDHQNEEAYCAGSGEGGDSGGYDLNETIKNEIINGVKKAISKDCLAAVEAKSKSAIEQVIADSVQKAQDTISNRALEFTNDWLENEVEITDKWGDPKEKITIKDLIKRSFDNLLEKQVDSNGKFTSGYGGKGKLIDYLTNQRVKDEVSARMAQFGKDIDSKIKASIDKSIKDNVSDRFAQMVIGAAKQDYQEAKALKSD